VSVSDASATCYLKATRAGDNNYEDSAASASFAVHLHKATQAAVTVTGPSDVTYGTTGTAAATGGSGTGTYSFSTGASTGCSVSGTTVSVSNASGSCTLTSIRAGNNNYEDSAASAPFTVTLHKATQGTVTVTGPTDVTYGTTGTATATGGNGYGAYSFSSTGSTGCSVTGTTVSMSDASGTCLLKVTKASDSNYEASAQSASFTVNLHKANQAAFSLTVPASIIYGNTGNASTLGGSGTGSVTYTVGGTGGCSVGLSTGVITVINANLTCSITASHAGDNNYNGGVTDGPKSVTLVKATATIFLSNFTQTYDNNPKPVTVATNPPGLTGIVVNYSGINGTSYPSTNTPPTFFGQYAVVATLTNDNYSATPVNGTEIVQPQSAQPVGDTFYTGAAFYWTTGSNSSTATLTLTATIRNTLPYGDIRTAKVTFCVRSGTSCTPINGAQNLPVGLVNPGDTSVGTAGAIVQYNIGSASAASIDVAVIVSGNYLANNAAFDAPVTIVQPASQGQIVGGGAIDNKNGATNDASGMLQGDINCKTTFSFFVQYNKSGTNQQGYAEFDITSYYKVEGTLDTVKHYYRFRSNSIATLARDLGTPGTKPPTAQFTAKANLFELVNGNEVLIEGNDIMNLTLTDKDTTGSANTLDTLGISVQRSKGGTWFTLKWDGSKTIEKAISNGNLSIN
jgi:hypothetical protein